MMIESFFSPSPVPEDSTGEEDSTSSEEDDDSSQKGQSTRFQFQMSMEDTPSNQGI